MNRVLWIFNTCMPWRYMDIIGEFVLVLQNRTEREREREDEDVVFICCISSAHSIRIWIHLLQSSSTAICLAFSAKKFGRVASSIPFTSQVVLVSLFDAIDERINQLAYKTPAALHFQNKCTIKKKRS